MKSGLGSLLASTPVVSPLAHNVFWIGGTIVILLLVLDVIAHLGTERFLVIYRVSLVHSTPQNEFDRMC